VNLGSDGIIHAAYTAHSDILTVLRKWLMAFSSFNVELADADD